jgi:hypothetical protein
VCFKGFIVLHNEYYRKRPFEKKKISGRGSQGAWRQDELIRKVTLTEDNCEEMVMSAAELGKGGLVKLSVDKSSARAAVTRRPEREWLKNLHC